MTSDKSAFDKIAKILRLAEGAGTTEGERAAAMARAQALAFKYNLDLSEIDTSEDPSATAIGEHEGYTEEEDWKGQLLNWIASVNFCYVYYYDMGYAKKGRKRWVIAGRPHNVQVVRQMYDYLAPQMEAEAMREVKRRGQLPRYALICVMEWLKRHVDTLGKDVPRLEFLPTIYVLDPESPQYAEAMERAREDLVPLLRGDSGLEIIMSLTGLTKAYASEIRPYIKRGELAPEVVKDLKSWKYSFQMAMSARVYTRLLEDRKRLEEDAGDMGTALVRREGAALELFIDKQDLKDGSESNRRWDHAGAAAGREAGDRVSITERQSLAHSRGQLGS